MIAFHHFCLNLCDRRSCRFVDATEVSAEEYLAYTTEETEKVEVYGLAEKLGGDIEAAIRQLAEKRRNKETTNN